MKKLQPSPSLACLGRASAFMVISDSVLVAHQCGSGPPPKPPPPCSLTRVCVTGSLRFYPLRSTSPLQALAVQSAARLRRDDPALPTLCGQCRHGRPHSREKPQQTNFTKGRPSTKKRGQLFATFYYYTHDELAK